MNPLSPRSRRATPTALLASSLSLACLLPAQAAERALKVYFIGNSLTASLTPDRVHALFAQRGIDLQFGSQLSGGKSLIRHLNYTKEPDQKWISWETNIPAGATFGPDMDPYDKEPASRFGRFEVALKDHKWDEVVFQQYGSTLHDDFAAITAFIDLALQNKSCERFRVYSTWPKRKRSETAAGGVENLDYPAAWTAKYTAGIDDTSKTAGQNYNSRDNSAQLVAALNKRYPDLPAPIRLIPAGEVLFALDAKIKAGKLPGLEDLAKRAPDMLPGLDVDTKFSDGINVLYADPIHLNPLPHKGNTLGIFASGSTVFTCLSGQSPVGISGAPYGLDDKADAALIKAVQETIWEVVTADPSTGISR